MQPSLIERRGSTVCSFNAVTRPVIAVLGSTGLQGGAVVAALLRQDNFLVRALTRSAAKAGDLGKEQTVDVVEADMGSKASLVKAFSGAAGVFIVTDFFAAGLDPEKEAQWGINAVDAAKEAGVSHVVFSTLEDVRKHVPKGALPKRPNEHVVPHFESKDAVLEHLKASGVPWTALLTSCFMENFSTKKVYKRQPDGARAWSDNLGSKPILAHAVADIGGSAADPAKYAGKTVPVARELVSWPDVAQTLSEVTGIPVKYAPISDDQYAKLPYPGAVDIGVMWQYCRDFSAHEDLRPLTETVYQGPTFREWAHANKEALSAALNK